MPNNIDSIVKEITQHAELIVRLFSDERTPENYQNIAQELVKWDVTITACFKNHANELIKSQGESLVALHNQITELSRNEKQLMADELKNLDKGKKAVAAYNKNKY